MCLHFSPLYKPLYLVKPTSCERFSLFSMWLNLKTCEFILMIVNYCFDPGQQSNLTTVFLYQGQMKLWSVDVYQVPTNNTSYIVQQWLTCGHILSIGDNLRSWIIGMIQYMDVCLQMNGGHVNNSVRVTHVPTLVTSSQTGCVCQP